MESFSILNHKGGVGKTTLAVHIAEGIAREGEDVVLIDLDPQGTATEYFNLLDNNYTSEKSISDIILKEVDYEKINDLVINTDEKTKLIPSHEDLWSLNYELYDKSEELNNLHKALHYLDHDFVIIDSQPSINPTTDLALMASREVVVPIKASDASIRPINKLLDEIDELEDFFDTDIVVSGVIPNLVHNDSVSKRIVNLVDEDLGNLVMDPIKKRVDFEHAFSNGQTLYKYNPDNDMIPRLKNICKELKQWNHLKTD